MYKELLYSKLLVESVRSKSTGEFHYVYVVVSNNRPDYFYFGKHSTHNLNDGYLGSSADGDWNSLERNLYPIAFFETDKEAIDYETFILQEYDLKNNPFCINRTNNDYIQGGWNKGISINEQHREYAKNLYVNENLSITKIGLKLGLSKGSVMVLLKQAGVIFRENRTTSYGDKYWREHIHNECERRGMTVVYIPSRLSKWSKIKVYCECGGEREVLVTGLKLGQTCCRHFSKQGERNPMKNKVPHNKGKKCPGLGGRPEGIRNSKPFSTETRKKYSQARKRITANGQPWSGFHRPKDNERPDKLYFIKLHNGKYKVGRSYKGWLYRKKETSELLGEWSGKSIDIWNLEKKVLNEFSQYKAPLNEMSMGRGMTEHFVNTLPVQDVIEFIAKSFSTEIINLTEKTLKHL